MKANEIRAKWLEFFESKGHHIEPSASLVPHNDPSLLWINAGMAPLKPYFDGRVKPDNPRIANSQKCIRTNDIENVGKTRRHHTFFEMLGNFSIGDYFKEEAITWAWEFLTDKRWIGFDPSRLYVTVYNEDEEAYKLWNEKIGLPADHIIKTGDDNFWDIGEGPCGPCTEIFYDRGEKYGTLESDPECYPSGENERYLEVWNLVFSQFNHNKDGSYTPLPNKNIDTGAGLERFASILQDVDSNFDTDLFQPIIQASARVAGVTYKENEKHDVALKVIADHVRTVVFAVADGVLPSNEGRGYVIRRLLRRAVRYGKVLGIDRPFLVELVPHVGDVMGGYYPDIVEKREFIEKVIRNEEERFHETLADGLAILGEMADAARAEGRTQITGAEAFKLYDTYGFPLDLTEDYAAEHGLTVDHEGFDEAMQAQRERARAARQDGASMKIQGGPLAELTIKSEFVGYNELVTQSNIVAMFAGNEAVEEVKAGDSCQIVLDRTPFYAESGGQVSDGGTLTAPGTAAVVEEVFKAPHGQHVLVVRVTEGSLRTGMNVQAAVARAEREDIVKNHTATHLLHKALKQVLGEHVNQAGSLVEAERLRFDFTHLGAIQPDELQDIERRVNEQIWNGIGVVIESKAIDEAKAMGAMALFGEKYGDIVRVVQVGDYSIELCGGCHVRNTSEIGLFKVVSESGIGSGVRRLEAVTGRHAYQYMESQLELLKQAAGLLKANAADVPKRVEGMFAREKELARENESLKAKLSSLEAGQLTDRVRSVAGIPVLAAQVDAGGMDALRTTADELKAKLPGSVIALASAADGKVNLVVAVAPELVKQGLHAGKLIKELASVCGGGGGGRPDMAQAGGKDPGKIDDALRLLDALVAKQLESGK
ncbi:alanine--tRNA ligase [Paenibacillus thiaminolyticus]|uniref:Alanine--tRNA ligase n=1 Tax=Paenibacillus thiaminolyticus TaxID=49283 RepID=A0AAP9J4H4_PANTH|nr:alanine--tRNA ligase [Paenibacillus thiaminolyticus]MCY9535392.1 alanine--tRNA ligase [Paenibacillus thiaminolyticus]MCY9603331.1 alanine--tRNA ligase [Paenibacillus thiaminolyticus]MCY9607426.1 alanine--tRNA ligase [Paenibacillus thiaminolyticus]MCY9616484.1 alanine--tRNA ligase [Paenibacillus thiaminolyticus]MCY9621232.1 alanine--tRNA ligase [Paenibacillus thiaminolyticus]